MERTASSEEQRHADRCNERTPQMMLLPQSETRRATPSLLSSFARDRTATLSVVDRNRFLLVPENLPKQSTSLAATNGAADQQNVANECFTTSSTSLKSVRARRKSEERHAGAWAFLVAPQKVAKKSQEYEKKSPRYFSQLAFNQSDVFSFSIHKLIRATNKTSLPNPAIGPFLPRPENVSKQSDGLAVSGRASRLQPVVVGSFAFNATGAKSGAGIQRMAATPSRLPWPLSASFALRAVKSPRLRVSPSPRLLQ